jgi:parallel beta-helix repeat protein
MLRASLNRLLSILVIALAAHHAVASTTYLVGTCKSGLKSFSTISAALAATPAPNTVMVCPGTYPEQVEITIPVTLEGITAGNSAQAIITPPPNGFVANATDDFAQTYVVQLYVNNVAGVVNVTNLTLDAEGQGVYPDCTVGLFYQNTSGTAKELTTRNQNYPDCLGGRGIYVEGGATNPTVTVENNSVHNFNAFGIFAETNSSVSELNATIENNYVNGGGNVTYGIYVVEGATGTVTGNTVVNNAAYGIFSDLSFAGSIADNTLVGNGTAIFEPSGSPGSTAGVPITSNKIYDSANYSIESALPAQIEGNKIGNAAYGIEFVCQPNPNVKSNTFNDVGTALNDVPPGTVSTNSYFNVGTIESGGTCSADAVRAQPIAPGGRNLAR